MLCRSRNNTRKIFVRGFTCFITNYRYGKHVDVVCVESDSFGWLSGVIQTPVGKIVFG